MERIVSFLPPSHTLSILGLLQAPVTVSRLNKSIGGLSGLWLSDPNLTIGLKLDYHSVAFKFEVFQLVIDASPPPSNSDRIEVAQIGGWDTVRCLFRFEWERPAKPGELPSHYEQVIGERGESDEVPSTALRAAVTMIGLAFWNDAQDVPVAVILNNDVDRVTFRVFEGPEEVAAALVGCENVRPEDIPSWSLKLQPLGGRAPS